MQQRDKQETKQISTRMMSIKTLLQIPEYLKSHNHTDKFQICFDIKEQDQNKFTHVNEQINKKRQILGTKLPFYKQKAPIEKESQSESDQISDESDIQSDSSNCQSDLEQEKSKQKPKFKEDKESNKYVFLPPSGIRDFFYKIYEKEIAQLEKRYSCQIVLKDTNTFDIFCEEATCATTIRNELFAKCNSLHYFRLFNRYKILIHSLIVQQQLKAKNIFMLKSKQHDIIIWSERKYMKEEDFNETRQKLLFKRYLKRLLVFLKQQGKKKSFNNKLLGEFFKVFETTKRKSLRKISQIYGIIIEPIPKYLQLIVHLDDVEFFSEVGPLIRKQFETLMLFSISMNIGVLKQIELSNLCRKSYKFIGTEMFNAKRFAIAFPFSKINKYLASFIKDIIKLGVIGNGSQLIICFSNLSNNEITKKLLNDYLPSGVLCEDTSRISKYVAKVHGDEPEMFEKILLKLGCILEGESMEESKISQTFNVNNETFMEQSTFNLNQNISLGTLEKQSQYKRQDSEYKESVLQNISFSKPNNALQTSFNEMKDKQQDNIPESQLNKLSTQQEQEKDEEYDVQFKLVKRVSKSNKPFEFHRKHQQKPELEALLQAIFPGKQFLTKCIQLPQKWFEKQLVDPHIYATNQSFIQNQQPKRQIKIQKLDSKIGPFNYLIQACNVKKDGDQFSVEFGNYLPVYQVSVL